jgi:hypothetical protein
MKQLLLLACLLALCAASPFSVAQTAKTYSWMLDMFVLSFDSVIITVLTPIWWFASFFANCQTCYVDMVNNVMETIPLSYKYV